MTVAYQCNKNDMWWKKTNTKVPILCPRLTIGHSRRLRRRGGRVPLRRATADLGAGKLGDVVGGRKRGGGLRCVLFSRGVGGRFGTSGGRLSSTVGDNSGGPRRAGQYFAPEWQSSCPSPATILCRAGLNHRVDLGSVAGSAPGLGEGPEVSCGGRSEFRSEVGA